jgi:shikimate kinase
MRIFLIGFMGSGKTTLGKQLASRLGYQFIDNDHLIEDQTGMTIAEFFTSHGESKFREVESTVLKSMEQHRDVVVSTGGGAPCYFDNMEVMNQLGTTIYIKVDPKTLAHRLRHSHTERPVLQGKTDDALLQFIIEKLSEREAFYIQAQKTVQSSNLKVDDLLTVLKHES